MTIPNRFLSFFNRSHPPAPSAVDAVVPPALPVSVGSSTAAIDSPIPDVNAISETRPHWLTDRDSLRDEGVLFGLSDARPTEKIAEIVAYFRYQTLSAEVLIDQQTATADELNRRLGQCETQVNALQERVNELNAYRPVADTLIQTVVSLVLSAAMCVGTFYLVDETLRPAFSNRWIAVGVFLTGMFNLPGRTSFFYEEGSRLTGRRLVAEIGLPLAASVFVLMQALQTQSVGQAAAVFFFVLLLFLLAGKTFLNTLIALRNDLAVGRANQQRMSEKRRNVPIWESQIVQLNYEINDLRVQQLLITSAHSQAEASLTRLNARRDELVNVFLSEFELARSLRDRLSEQQRKSILYSL